MEPIKVKFWYEYLEERPTFTGCLIDKDKDIFWFKNGLLHREDGPAIEYASGSKFWYKNGECHREDGPAVEFSDGDKSWFCVGIEYTDEQTWKIAIRKIKLEKVLKKING